MKNQNGFLFGSIYLRISDSVSFLKSNSKCSRSNADEFILIFIKNTFCSYFNMDLILPLKWAEENDLPNNEILALQRIREKAVIKKYL